MLLADVSGDGAGVGGVAAELRDLMARFVKFLDQREFFGAMNRRFTAMRHDGGFATAVVLTDFAPTATLSVSNAGHPGHVMKGNRRQVSGHGATALCSPAGLPASGGSCAIHCRSNSIAAESGV